MSGTSAGGSPTPPAGGTHRSAATIDGEQFHRTFHRILHDALRVQAKVLRAARSWRRSLTDDRIASASSADRAFLAALSEWDTARDSLHTAIRDYGANSRPHSPVTAPAATRCDVRGCGGVATWKLATATAWVTVCAGHHEHLIAGVWSPADRR